MAKEPGLWDQAFEQPFMDFREARAHARSLELKSREEWDRYIEGEDQDLPWNIPPNPDEIYRYLGWKGWDDWLGVAREKEKPGSPSGVRESTLWDPAARDPWLPFQEAREKARNLGFEYREEWEAYINGSLPGRAPLPPDIPPHPDRIYRHNGWEGWTDWLVPPAGRKSYAPFYMAREFARSFRCASRAAWFEQAGTIRQAGLSYGLQLPEKPDLEYAGKGWEDWNDWLGAGINYKSFVDTRRFVHSLKLESREEWALYCQGLLPHHPRKPRNIYAFPDIAYLEEGWKDWDDWLGI